jgi:hypothetical protein
MTCLRGGQEVSIENYVQAIIRDFINILAIFA